ESFFVTAEGLADVVRAANARIIWYATWARRAGDPFYASTGLDPTSMTTMLEADYQYVAHTSGGFVARVGAAWQIALAELPDVNLYQDDGSHPTPAATLLTACVMLQAITGRTPRVPDPAPLGIDQTTAMQLCAIAPRVECTADRTRCGDDCSILS